MPSQVVGRLYVLCGEWNELFSSSKKLCKVLCKFSIFQTQSDNLSSAPGFQIRRMNWFELTVRQSYTTLLLSVPTTVEMNSEH